ncbi:MAG: amino acid racemase [Anaerovibrio sp.]|uniref:aspartate/glutamate racemase family protein n=1 Tax=Anaerovibrio sp. TaxID=1872532 RepID=UPI0025EFC45E|nr:amino acid racemase [Anaerovibrio sp.]MCR5177073.1 amino acid racemase [Anaerovibrio sp.]
MKAYSIGVLGGMGTYATIKMFQQYAEIFPAVKEWERPRIIIDNNCTMPSRVRAALYDENRDELIKSMTQSLELLLHAGVARIILACNTSHLFLEDIYKLLPEAKEKVVNIIDTCVSDLARRNIEKVYLLASEGTILSGVYQTRLKSAGIKYDVPQECEFDNLRYCIEAVKQSKYDDKARQIFTDFINQKGTCILGCTELPVLYDLYKKDIKNSSVINPLECALNFVHEDYLKNRSK